MPLDSKHPEYTESLSRWKKMRDCYDGQEAIKAAGVTYLPATKGQILDGMGTDQIGAKDYDAYLQRAVFHDLVQIAVETLIGILNAKPPTVTLPPGMEPLLAKVNQRGESVTALLRRIHEQQLVTGRCGLIADLPISGTTDTIPYIDLYTAESIINWDDNEMGDGDIELRLIVLQESGKRRLDDFSWEDATNYRVLAMVGGEYKQGLFAETDSYSEEMMKTPVLRGRPLASIPFVIANSKDCLPQVDKSPLLGLAELALCIYRLEADYRQCLFMQGQDTLVIIGGVRKDSTGAEGAVRVGAGAMIEVDSGGDAKYIGVQSAGLPEMRSALENDKQLAAVKTGQLMAPGKASLESGEALKTRVAAQTATLTQIAETSCTALEMNLKTIATWMGLDPALVVVKPNKDFTNWTIQGQDIVQLITAKRLGAPISLESIHQTMKERGLTHMDYAAELKVLEKDATFIELISALGGNGNNPVQQAGGPTTSTQGNKEPTNTPKK